MRPVSLGATCNYSFIMIHAAGTTAFLFVLGRPSGAPACPAGRGLCLTGSSQRKSLRQHRLLPGLASQLYILSP